ncbi:MAG TPA: universal stress protein [Thermoleophilaceae bacterium]|nr:universal stress protein [Thermoleophilaceae bacterium]
MAQPAETAFARIVCAIDPSAPSGEAAGQAVALARAGAELTFLAVEGDGGGRALEQIARTAAKRGVNVKTRTVRGENVPEAVIESSSSADLLVVGSRGAGGADVELGSTASAAVHAAQMPVLVARPVPDGRAFPGQILVATDGSPDAERGVELANRIADRHGSEVALIHVSDGRSPPAAVQAQPTIEEVGDPAQRIAEAAVRERASLLVIGSRGLGRARVLGSVGERVAHEASCSVLVVRPRVIA